MKLIELVTAIQNSIHQDGTSLRAEIYAVDQFGATQSPVMDFRVDDEGNVILDIEVPTDQ